MNKHRKNRDGGVRFNKFLYIFVNISFIIPIIFLILLLVFGNIPSGEVGYHSRADYTLMLLQCAFGLFAIHLPMILSRQFKFELPMFLFTLYIVFLYCAIFLGEVRSFYYVIPMWDSILHMFSSLMLGFFGFMVITILNRNEKVIVNLSPLFVALFAFCFALTVGSLWEIYEYVFDGILGSNMQKFATSTGEILEGHEALSDTMKDIIIDACGAVISSVVGYFAVLRDEKWIFPKLIEK